ncbi:hypothetical protein GTQ40_17535 [Flavobacteriaceae bacterium R38]|nr:hypothetical protein [Flavobacteriaceae bacterium R38]
MKKKFIILSLLATIFMACSSDDDGAGAPPPTGQDVNVVLNEIEYLGDQVELLNAGTEAVDVSSFFLCLGPGTYRQISALPVVSGTTTIQPGGFLVVTYDQINATAGQINGANATGGLGLYVDNSDFADSDTLLDFVQWGAAGSVRENTAVAAGQWTAGQFVQVVGDADNSIIYDGTGNTAADFAETTAPSFGAANGDPVAPVEEEIIAIVLNEIEYLGDQVEILNAGNVAVDISDYFLCLGPQTYRQISALPVVSGEANLQPGEFLVVTYDQLNVAVGQINNVSGTGGLGLYIDNSDFTNAETLADFVQWGAAGSVREAVAVEAGQWTANEFVEVSNTDNTSIIFDGEGDAAADWAETATPSFGAANGAPVVPEASVVLNEVEYLGNQVELFNNGNVSVDVSDYFLCLGPQTYRQISALTTTGNLNLAPGEFLTIEYDLINVDQGNNSGVINGELGTGGLVLYVDNQFGNADSILDFVQWGAAGSFREGLAVQAGEWTAGEFVEVIGSDATSIIFDGEGNAAADWAETVTPSFGAANGAPVAPVIDVVLNEVEYLGDQVELFNAGNVSVDVSDYFLCLGPGTYRNIGGIVNGSTTVLAPGEFLVATYDQFVNGTGGLGLYINNSDFSDPDTLADFVQWGAAGSVREVTAVAAGQWTAGEFVEVIGSDVTSIIFDGLGNAAADWAETITPSFGAANGAPVAPVIDVVLNEVEFLGDQVELLNNGNLPVNVSDYFLCLGPATYRQIAGLPLVNGTLTLAPGEFLTVTYDQINTSAGQINSTPGTGGLGLYNDNVVNTGFGDANNLIDFVQWGAAGSIREVTAAAAGQWTVGEFVNVSANADNSIIFDGAGNAAADWAETTTPSFGGVNGTPVAPVASVVINEVEFRGDQVELYNNGDFEVNLAGYFLCMAPGTYRQIGNLAITNGGNIVLQPGEFLVVTYDQINVGNGLIGGQEGTGGLGLYSNGSFTNPNSLMDYVQWGAAGSVREGVANSAGEWTTGDIVNISGSTTNTLSFDGQGNASADWTEGTSTLGLPNN